MIQEKTPLKLKEKKRRRKGIEFGKKREIGTANMKMDMDMSVKVMKNGKSFL